MLKLPNVTLVALGSENISGMVKALEYSSREIEFGKVKLISHVCPRLHRNSPIQYEYNPKTQSIDDWNYHIIYNLPDHIDTDFAILIHPDGFIVHPESWRDEFLKYDYIGAPWPLPTDDYSYRDKNGEIIRVGNSISLRSKLLLDLAPNMNLRWQSFYGFYHEDGFITVNNRHYYIEAGLKFAPLEVAKWFSRELEIPENQDVDKPFCFHKHFGRNVIYPNFELA